MHFTVLLALASAALVAGAPIENKESNVTPKPGSNPSPLPLSAPKFPPSGTFPPPPPPTGYPPDGSKPPPPPPSATSPSPVPSPQKPEDKGTGKARRADSPPPSVPGAAKPDQGHPGNPSLPPPSGTKPPPPPPSSTKLPPPPSSPTPGLDHVGTGKAPRADTRPDVVPVSPEPDNGYLSKPALPPLSGSKPPPPPPSGTKPPPPPPSGTMAPPAPQIGTPESEHEGSGKARRAENPQPVGDSLNLDHGDLSKPHLPPPSSTNPPPPPPSITPKPKDDQKNKLPPAPLSSLPPPAYSPPSQPRKSV